MRRHLFLALLPLLAAAAQDQLPKFEVASIKPAARRPMSATSEGRTGAGTGGCTTTLKMDRSQVRITCATLPMLIGYAFRIPPDRVKGPDWMMNAGSPRFDIAAALPLGASPAQVPEMVQSLLADRFSLLAHRDTTTQPVYALVVAKGGIRMKAVEPPAPTASDPEDAAPALGFFGDVEDRTIPNPNGKGSTTTISSPSIGTVRQTGGETLVNRWETDAITLEGLAGLLDKVIPLPLPVIDATGLKGRYQLDLTVGLPTSAESARFGMDDEILRRFNDGLQKLGLQLERRKGPIAGLTVDRLEKSPTEN